MQPDKEHEAPYPGWQQQPTGLTDAVRANTEALEHMRRQFVEVCGLFKQALDGLAVDRERLEKLESKGGEAGGLAHHRERGPLLLQMAQGSFRYDDPQALEDYLESQIHALSPRAVAAVLLYCAELRRENARLKRGQR